MSKLRRIFVDVETTGISKIISRVVELAYIVYLGDEEKRRYSELVEPYGFTIPQDAIDVHGITNEKATEEGLPITEVMIDFNRAARQADLIIAHNAEFDIKVIANEMSRIDNFPPIALNVTPVYCTMKNLTHYCELDRYDRYGNKMQGYKWPTLWELYRKVFGEEIHQTHRALEDLEYLSECYFELLDEGVIEGRGE
ncbi:MAG: exonuclease domain-containing protein [Candidatus Natronoplasma sp.]